MSLKDKILAKCNRKSTDCTEIPRLSFPRCVTTIFCSFILSRTQLCRKELFYTRSLKFGVLISNWRSQIKHYLFSHLVPLTTTWNLFFFFSKSNTRRKRFYFVKLLSSGITFKLLSGIFVHTVVRSALPLVTGLFNPSTNNICEFIPVSYVCSFSPTTSMSAADALDETNHSLKGMQKAHEFWLFWCGEAYMVTSGGVYFVEIMTDGRYRNALLLYCDPIQLHRNR